MRDSLGAQIAVAAIVIAVWMFLVPPDNSPPPAPGTELVELRDIATDSLIYRGSPAGLDSLIRAKPELLEPLEPQVLGIVLEGAR